MFTQSIRLEPIHKGSMLAQVRQTGEFVGYVAPCNTHPSHVADGWHIGHPVTIVKGDNVGLESGKFYYFNAENEAYTELEHWLGQYMYYNGNSQLGRRPRFFKEVN